MTMSSFNSSKLSTTLIPLLLPPIRFPEENILLLILIQPVSFFKHRMLI